MRELPGFPCGEINDIQVHAGVAIRDEINFVVGSPHWADILGRVVGEVFGGAGFEIVNPNIVGHAASIIFPGAELAEDAVVSHFGIVGRKGAETAPGHRQLLREVAIESHGVERTDKVVE